MPSPATATIQLETETTRVTRWNFAPGTETGAHRHEYDYIVVPVTSGVLTLHNADGSVAERAITVGESYQGPAGVDHNVINQSDEHVAFVEIELLNQTA